MTQGGSEESSRHWHLSLEIRSEAGRENGGESTCSKPGLAGENAMELDAHSIQEGDEAGGHVQGQTEKALESQETWPSHININFANHM